ncbi:MAG: hypothetical protein ACI9LU_000226 [Polaribacter sp.]|jgi:hypothetical protein
MILRRLTKHVKDQNWFAVAVETLIVVLCVFLGLQVNNWNTENTARVNERQLLSQLQSDVEAAVSFKTVWFAEIQAHRKLLIEAVDVVQNKPDKQIISDAQCRAMWSSHLLFYPVAPLGSLDEMLAKSSLYTSSGQALRPALLKYRDQLTVIMQLNTTLSGLANLGDNYSHAFPRRLTDVPELDVLAKELANEQVARLTDATFNTACILDTIRADQSIQNKLLSNIARTDGVVQRVHIELTSLEKIKADLLQAKL